MNEARRALELLNERGWCRGEWQNEKGELCIAGALNLAAGLPAEPGHIWANRGSRVALEIIREQYGLPGVGFTSFNDDPAYTFADVERVLEKTAVRLDEGVDW